MLRGSLNANSPDVGSTEMLCLSCHDRFSRHSGALRSETRWYVQQIGVLAPGWSHREAVGVFALSTILTGTAGLGLRSRKSGRRLAFMRTIRTLSLFFIGSIVAFSLGGCSLLAELLGEGERGDGAETQVCTVAEACCVELNKATAYDDAIERAQVRGWPNHCPSWNARPASECTGFLSEIEKQGQALEKDHPIFHLSECTPSK